MISAQKWEQLRERMGTMGIEEHDLNERFVLGSGSGGQKINKTASCVHLLHRPSGLEVRCQRSRSQADNRYWARREICEKMDDRRLGRESARQQAMEKVRRQKRRRSRRAKNKMLDDKSRRAQTKVLRRPPSGD